MVCSEGMTCSIFLQVQSLQYCDILGAGMTGKICELCTTAGGTVLWASPTCRVVLVDDPGYPGFCRVVWTAHVREMSDLEPAQRQSLMNVVFAVETVVRSLFTPDKINLAGLANLPRHPESVPVNMLVRVQGTPLADEPDLDPFEFIRTIAVARILMPASHVRLSAGREEMNEQMHARAYWAGANASF